MNDIVFIEWVWQENATTPNEEEVQRYRINVTNNVTNNWTTYESFLSFISEFVFVGCFDGTIVKIPLGFKSQKLKSYLKSLDKLRLAEKERLKFKSVTGLIGCISFSIEK